ncbi:MAG: hypothetical protein HFJ65_02755 [Eggerthellaceae bacterium]|nr:hypothetical protein [Eggerthellaceae bacterium]
MTDHADKSNAAKAEGRECVSCSCCCPFRHATRDDATGKISIMCGNAARADLGVPTMRQER